MNNTQRAYLELHFAVLLYGFTAILGGLIDLSAIILVWWRIFITCSAILVYGNMFSRLKNIPRSVKFRLWGVGFIVATHWLAFFGSIKLANASVALVMFSTTSFQSSLLEPLLTRQRIKWYEVSLGIIIVPAMMFVVNGLSANMTMGVWAGLLSAFLAVLFSILNKKMIETADPLSITFLNLSGGWIWLSVLLPFYFKIDATAKFMPTGWDWVYLLILALVCTNLGYILGIRALRHLSAFTSNLTINLEPVYGIILAWLILKEDKQLNTSFYIGAGMIILAVLAYPFMKKRFSRSTD
jgi:drug/metabolite transporter (DMT)-like permease